MKTRYVAILLAILLLGGMLAGCQSGTATPTATATTAAVATTAAAATTVAATTTVAAATTTAATTIAAVATTTAPPATTQAKSDLEQVTLNFWMGCQGKQKDTDEVHAYLQQQINEYLPNTDIEWTLLTFGEYDEKWTKALAAGETIDMSWYGWMRTVGDDANDGTILSFDPYLDEYGQNIKAYFGDRILDLHRSADGGLYFIPAWQGLCANRWSMYIRKQAADSLDEQTRKDITDVYVKNQFETSLESRKENMDVLTRILEQTKAAGTIGSGVGGVTTYPIETNSIYRVGTYGMVMYGDSGFKVVDLFDNEYWKFLYQTAAEWYDAGYIPADIASRTDTNGWAEDGDNGVTFSLGGTQGYEDPAGVFSTRYGIEFENYSMFGDDLLVLGTPTGECLPMTSKNPERAVMLLDLLFAPEGKEIYRTFVYGLEDKHYKRTTDNDTIDLLTGTGEPQSDWAYGIPAWVLGTCEDIFNTAAGTVNIYKKYKNAEATAYAPPLLAFSFDNTDVSVEQAQIKTVVDEYDKVLTRGVKGTAGWEAYYKDFLDKLQQAGIDSYLAEVQSQVDTFVAERGVKW
ncbi:MAG: ABC transporter substrate-binding protein [Clostridiaceae bacterium]|nr:ABC transporter substrate-binding protein [Clostridiaceae bacterium]